MKLKAIKLKNDNETIGVGDLVKIKSKGGCYSRYDIMAKKMGLNYFDSDYIPVEIVNRSIMGVIMDIQIDRNFIIGVRFLVDGKYRDLLFKLDDNIKIVTKVTLSRKNRDYSKFEPLFKSFFEIYKSKFNGSYAFMMIEIQDRANSNVSNVSNYTDIKEEDVFYENSCERFHILNFSTLNFKTLKYKNRNIGVGDFIEIIDFKNVFTISSILSSDTDGLLNYYNNQIKDRIGIITDIVDNDYLSVVYFEKNDETGQPRKTFTCVCNLDDNIKIFTNFVFEHLTDYTEGLLKELYKSYYFHYNSFREFKEQIEKRSKENNKIEPINKKSVKKNKDNSIKTKIENMETKIRELEEIIKSTQTNN